jgi:hypothetical protein
MLAEARAPRRGKELVAAAARAVLEGAVASSTRRPSLSRRKRLRLQSIRGRASPGRAPPFSAAESVPSAGAGVPNEGPPDDAPDLWQCHCWEGFFNIDVEPFQPWENGEVFAAVIRFMSAPLSDIQVSNELKHLVDEAWDWQAVKISESEFSVRFPSRETLRMSTRSGNIFLPLSQSEAKIREAFLEVRPGKAFPSAWVQISGLPKDLMAKDRIMAALTMVGRTMDVDELSVKKHETEPVRVRF